MEETAQPPNTRTVSRFQVQASVDVEDHYAQDEVPSTQHNGSSPTEQTTSKVDFSLPLKLLKTPREIKLKFTVMVLFVIILVGTIFILLYYQEEPYHYDLGGLTLYVESNSLVIKHGSMKRLQGSMGEHTPAILPATCTPTSDENLCVEWRNYGKLRIALEKHNVVKDIQCYHVSWEVLSPNSPMKDCYSMSNAHWFGGSTIKNQAWPIGDLSMNDVPFITSSREGDFGSVIEQYWVTSRGASVKVDKETPLIVTIQGQDNRLCLESHYKDEFYLNGKRINRSLNYTICTGSDLKSVYNGTRVFPLPTSLPSIPFLERPLWSIDGYSQGDLDSSTLITIAKTLSDKGLATGLMDIRAGFAPVDGDLMFDPQGFNASFVPIIKDMGFDVSVAITPFANTESETFGRELNEDYFVKDPRGEVPGLVSWDRGVGAMVDVTNRNISTKFKKKLDTFMSKENLDFLTFDYGEASYLPYGFQASGIFENPSGYTTKFNELAQEVVEGTVITRSAYHNQNLPVVIRTYPKGENWDKENGIKTVIPTVLTLSLLGYPFMALDVQVFDTSGKMESEFTTMDRELLIRYIEISAFLPVMQIPISVLNYDSEMMDVVKEWVVFHKQVVIPEIMAAMADFMNNGNPVIRPMWWLSNEDEALTCGSQFLIGDSLIVAPIVDRGVTQKMVYLPAGNWQYPVSGEEFVGPGWVNVSAELRQVPYFEKVTA